MLVKMKSRSLPLFCFSVGLFCLKGTERAEISQTDDQAVDTRPAQAQNPAGCLPYEPSVVELTGTLIRETFPGPPNYESAQHGDAPEVYWLLRLSRPICVDADKTEPGLNPEQKDVRRIQLVFSDAKVYKTQRALLGKGVLARGTLFGAHTGHH